MKTAMQELIHYIECVMNMYEKDESKMTVSDRKAYDAYHNVLFHAKSKLGYEKKQIIDAYKDGVTGDSNTSNPEQYYNETFKN